MGLVALPDLECVDPVLELSGVNERPQDVVLEVAEAQGDSSEVFEASVDGLDGAVGGAHVEVGQDLAVALPQ